MSKKDNTTTNRRDRHQQHSSKSFYKRLAICTTIVYLAIAALTLLGVVHPFGASCTSPLSRFIYQSTRHSSQAQAATCLESSGSDCNTGYYDSVRVATYSIGPFECERGLISLLVCGILPICVVIALIVARIYYWKLHHATNDRTIYISIGVLYVVITAGILTSILCLLYLIDPPTVMPELINIILLFCVIPAIALFIADRLIWLATRKIKQ